MYFTTLSVSPVMEVSSAAMKSTRMMRLQIRGVISQQRVRRRVRLVESVSGKLRHQIENLFDLLRRKAALRRPLHKALALRRHFLGFFFPIARRSRSASPSE